MLDESTGTVGRDVRVVEIFCVGNVKKYPSFVHNENTCEGNKWAWKKDTIENKLSLII